MADFELLRQQTYPFELARDKGRQQQKQLFLLIIMNRNNFNYGKIDEKIDGTKQRTLQGHFFIKFNIHQRIPPKISKEKHGNFFSRFFR